MSTQNEIALLTTELAGVEITPATIATKEFTQTYETLLNYIAQLDEIKSQVNEKIKMALEANYNITGESSLHTDKYCFTYKPETTAEKIDSKKLKEAYPELYVNFVKVSNVKSSLTVRKVAEKEQI